MVSWRQREFDAENSKDPVVQAVMLLREEVRDLRKELEQERKDAAKRWDREARSGRQRLLAHSRPAGCRGQ